MMEKTELSFVNVNGDAVYVPTAAPGKKRIAPARQKREAPSEYHNGWRVIGLPPGALEEARAAHELETANAHRHNEKCKPSSRVKVPAPWNDETWLMKAKTKAVRSKPYEVPEAAQECKALAIKAGWLRVEVVELKKEKGVSR